MISAYDINNIIEITRLEKGVNLILLLILKF